MGTTYKRNEAPIPDAFPGEFFVLRWDRDVERFFLELDEPGAASYDLGSDPLHVTRLLGLRGYERRTRDDAVDRAREFGACQCIPDRRGPDGVTLRLIQILPRSVPTPPLFQEKEHGWFPGF